MFYSCSGLTSLDLSNFDTSKVTDMMSMFSSCESLTSLNVSNFNISKDATIMFMINHCSNLTTIRFDNTSFDNVFPDDCMLYDLPNGINVYVKDETAKSFIEARLSDASTSGTVIIASLPDEILAPLEPSNPTNTDDVI